DPPDASEAIEMLDSVCARLASHHGSSYSNDAIERAVSWSVRYLPGRALPEKAVAILDLAGARAARRLRANAASASGPISVTPEIVAEVVSEMTEVPTERLLQTDGERMLQLEERLAERVVGH